MRGVPRFFYKSTMQHTTTTNDLPEDVRAAGIEMTEPLVGGPAFDFPKHGTIDFSKLSLASARALVEGRFKHLRLKAQPEAPAPEAAPEMPTPLPDGKLAKAKA
jgi:hypothetical protein